MPSGAKKRKAAKKKKEIQPNTNPNPNPNPSASTQTPPGDGDDAGEISSPASQDHHHNTFSGGEEEIVKESLVPVEREFKNDDESDNKQDVKKSEHEEIASKSYNGDSSGSSSISTSSSDDESHENIPSVVVQEKIDLNIQTSNNSVECELGENGVKKLSSVEDNKVGVSQAFEDEASQQEENEIIKSVENVSKVSDTTECVAQETDDRLSLSYNAPLASADNRADHEKDSGVSEPLLAPAQNPEQASWKSCCGLFEAFTGPGR